MVDPLGALSRPGDTFYGATTLSAATAFVVDVWLALAQVHTRGLSYGGLPRLSEQGLRGQPFHGQAGAQRADVRAIVRVLDAKLAEGIPHEAGIATVLRPALRAAALAPTGLEAAHCFRRAYQSAVEAPPGEQAPVLPTRAAFEAAEAMAEGLDVGEAPAGRVDSRLVSGAIASLGALCLLAWWLQ